MDGTNDKINKLKNKIDKMYQDMSEDNNENKSKSKDRMKRLKTDLDEATKKMHELESGSKNLLEQEEETEFRYIHPKMEDKSKEDNMLGTSLVTKGRIDALIAKIRELRNTQ